MSARSLGGLLRAYVVGAGLLWGCSAYDSGELASGKPRSNEATRDDGGSADAAVSAPPASAGRGGSGSSGQPRRDGGASDADVGLADGALPADPPDAGTTPQDCTPNPGSLRCPLSCPER